MVYILQIYKDLKINGIGYSKVCRTQSRNFIQINSLVLTDFCEVATILIKYVPWYILKFRPFVVLLAIAGSLDKWHFWFPTS